jgi:cytochrome c biogenesis protein CcmG, thiol:disulfide interchange protein DsbE
MFATTSSTVRTLTSLTAFAALSFSVAACGGGGSGAAATGADHPEGPGHPLLGKPAPEITSEFVSGDGPKTIKDAAGKVLILDFWGTFCEPCKKSFPKYQEIVDANGGSVVVLAVSIDEPDSKKKEDLEAFAKEHKAKFAIAWDKDHKAAEAYGLGSLTMPSSFIIDKTGVVRHVHAGFKDDEVEVLNTELKALK